MHRPLWIRSLQRWMFAPRRRGAQKKPARALRNRVLPRLETLEDRTVLSPTTYTVIYSGANGDQVAGPTTSDPGAPIGQGDSGTLRYCIQQANLNTNPDGSIITFSSGGVGNINLRHGELDIFASNPVTITGQGETISGLDTTISDPNFGAQSRVFDISNPLATVTMTDLVITQGNASPTSSFTAGNQGGDIFNGGNLTLNDCKVENGFSLGILGEGGLPGRGGGIFNAEGQQAGQPGATLTLTNNTVVSNNTAQGATGGFSSGTSVTSKRAPLPGGLGAGGGLYNDLNAILIVTGNSQISNNSAKGGNGLLGTTGFSGEGSNGTAGGNGEGGGIFNRGTLTVTSSTLNDNTAQGGIGAAGGNGADGVAGFVGTTGLVGGPGGPGSDGGNGANGGTGGAGEGGGIFNGDLQYVAGTITGLTQDQFTGNKALGGAGGNGGKGGAGGVGGTGGSGTKFTGGTGGFGGTGGSGGVGGAAGAAQGGALYNAVGTLSINGSNFVADIFGAGNEAISGSGGSGGNGGDGGAGGVGGKGKTFGGKGGGGGAGGIGGFGNNAAPAGGGAVFNQGSSVTISGSTFTANLVQSGNTKGANGLLIGGGNGGNGGSGGLGGLGGAGGTAGGATGLNGADNAGVKAGLSASATGGALDDTNGNLNISTSNFGGNLANLGNKAIAGPGGSGGSGGLTSPFFDTILPVGNAGAATGGGNASGGAITVGNPNGSIGTFGNLSLTNSIVEFNTATAGAGGAGGLGSPAPFGGREANGLSANGGNASGGAVFDSIATSSGNAAAHSITIQTTPFSNNSAQAGNGGAAVLTSKQLSSSSTFVLPAVSGTGQGGGLYVSDPIGSITITASTSNFSNNTVTGGTTNRVILPAFNHGLGAAAVIGGAIDVIGSSTAPGLLTLNNSQISNNTITGVTNTNAFLASMGDNTANSTGSGGGIASNDYSLSLTASPVTSNLASATAVTGGGVSAVSNDQLTPVSYTLTSSNVTNNTIVQIRGIFTSSADNMTAAGLLRIGVQGAGLYLTNGNVSITSSAVMNNSATSVAGVNGQDNTNTSLGAGGNGEQGATAIGGGIFYLNYLDTILSFAFTNSQASANKLVAGPGGQGGGAGNGGGNFEVHGGSGGQGGDVEGGGIFLYCGFSSVTDTTITDSSFIGNILSGGNGGNGGSGALATGGSGGIAEGGGVFNNSLNGGQLSVLNIIGSTMAGNTVSGGIGGNAGTGTTKNGGDGGAGGTGGNADGGGLYEGDSTLMNVFNSTFGGPSPNPNNLTANSNVLAGGRGGAGGDAGTPHTESQSAFNGGFGGGGGNVEGGGVFVDNGNNATATFINDTIASNASINSAVGGPGGSGAGDGGTAGGAGTNGQSLGGGYFAAPTAGSTNKIGNTIVALNQAIVGTDVDGTFNSLGNNILGSTPGTVAPGFVNSDLTNVSAFQLQLATLQNNGGNTLTDALLANSDAIAAGSVFLVDNNLDVPPYSITTDQRGTGFNRIVNNNVDIGAFEVQAPPIAVSPLSLPAGLVGTAYSQTIVASGGSGGLTVTTNLLPSALSALGLSYTISGNDMKISGTPTATGTVSFTVNVVDGSGNKASESYTLTVNPAITFSPVSIPSGTLGVSYNQTILATGGTGGVTATYTVTSGTIPAGLNFSATGNQLGISGTPTTAGTLNFTLTATDSAGDVAAQNYMLIVNAAGTIIINPTTVPGGIVGTAYNQTITATGGSGTITVSYGITNGSVPGGLTFTPNGSTLSISGTPISSGSVTFLVTATDTSGDRQTQSETLTVASSGQLTFSPSNLPSGVLNAAYNQSIAVNGGSGTVTTTYTVTSGSIPNGLTFTPNGSTFTISGTPTAAGSVTFTVNASDTSGDTGSQSYTLTINTAAIGLSPSTIPNATVGTAYNQSITASGGSGTLSVTDNITSGSLPSGLNISTSGATLTISGTPTASGTVSFTVTATDTSGDRQTQSYTLTVSGTGSNITLSPSSVPAGTAGTAYSQSITASGGSGTVSVNYSITSGSLPSGLSFTPTGSTLVISGTPSASGSIGFTVTATDTSGDRNSQNYLLTINPATTSPSPSPSPSSPPAAPVLGTAMSIVSIHNSFSGFVQVETVTAHVSTANGAAVNGGFVTLDVYGQSVLAPVVNGTAIATVSSSLLDFSLLSDLFFSSPMALAFSDPGSLFMGSSTGTTVEPILLDFFMFLISNQLAPL